jgi:hypothetical protein
MEIPIIHVTFMGYISRMPQPGAQVYKGMLSLYCLQINILMPISPSGILLASTWVSTQSIDILVNLISL